MIISTSHIFWPNICRFSSEQMYRTSRRFVDRLSDTDEYSKAPRQGIANPTCTGGRRKRTQISNDHLPCAWNLGKVQS